MSDHLLSPLPWQQQLWLRLSGQQADGKLPHALLLVGHEGIGKVHFAKAFARLLTCLSPVNQTPCGNCKTCLLMKAGSHPDYLYLAPEDKSRVIKIDQVRQLTEFVAKTPQQGNHKVAIIEPAESLNLNAANALLKCLEEPAGNTTLILVSHMPSLLMATIRSRCQQLEFAIPDRSQSLEWLTPLAVGQEPEYLLDCAAGAPLTALELMDGDQLEIREQFARYLIDIAEFRISPLDVAQKLQGGDPLALVEMLLFWLQLSAKARFSDASPHHEGEKLVVGKLLLVREQLVFRLLDKLIITKRQLLSGSNPNKQLLLEELLMDWQALLKQSQRPQQARHSLLNGLN
ncbi:MAG: DNA polymerase III subunit delta' [Candidatus Pelagadaptatus aseana]|uniref:DNA polymerase III subunit delta' n=1 Tax=Candidatus Pelagadaptatus aseana TaxID=3120508 RepID=UPI0039B13276